VTLGGRRVQVERPRVRTADGSSEVPLRTYKHFADRDPFSRHVLEQLLAGVSTCRFERTREPVGAEVEAVARSTSRSAVSREFVSRTRESLLGLMSRRLDDLRLAVLKFALRADDLVDLFLHQLGKHVEPDTDAQGEQPFLRRAQQLPERLLHPRRQPKLTAQALGSDLPQRYGLHGGSSSCR
jgi:hypothetical protein